MVFSSVIFLFCFLPVCLIGYYLLDKKFRNFFLLILSVLFYAWGEPKFVFVMLASVFVNWAFGLVTSRFKERGDLNAAKMTIGVMVAFNIILFFIFKYLNWTISNIDKIFGDIIPQTHILLPIGISFFTFQAMSYVFDIYRGKGKAQKNPLNTALYITLFPQLIAGPIVRYETVSEQINNRSFNLDDFSLGIKRFIIGLAKKVIIANTVAIIADKAFDPAGIQNLTMLMAWLGVISYILQIYFDFSGYSDMAIGLGLMFGFHFNENFNYPYISKSITEFWRRWHISLGSWFRDYVYFPLGGSRVEKKSRLVFNLFVVWTLTGIWHGASWNFVFWGLFYFALLTFEKLTGMPKKLSEKGGLFPHLYRIFTLLCVMFGWVFFRAEGLKNGVKYVAAMIGLYGNPVWGELDKFLLYDHLIIFIVSILASIPIYDTVVKRIFVKFNNSLSLNIAYQCWISLVFIMSISCIIFSSYNPFIYFNF